jgi:hypothetical protein
MPDIVEDTALGALVDVLAAQDHSGTKTVYDDGSTDYTVKTDGASVTLHVAAAGTLTSMKTDGTELKVALAYAYGAQKITLPAASVTVDRATLNKAKVYVAMAADVKTAATNGAAHTRTAAKSKTVKVASLRQIVRKDVTTVNQGVCLTMIKAINVEDGVKVYATNPWTHQSVAYTVKASGKEVFVTKV